MLVRAVVAPQDIIPMVGPDQVRQLARLMRAVAVAPATVVPAQQQAAVLGVQAVRQLIVEVLAELAVMLVQMLAIMD